MVNILSFREKQLSRELTKDIRLAKCHDEEAFRRLIDKEKSKLYRIGKGILKSDFDVDDAIQETILKSWMNIDSLRDEKSFSTWITRILINECYKIIRKRENTKQIEDYNLIEKDNSHDVNNKIDVWNSLDKLSEEFKLPLILYFFEDFSYEEISIILKIPKGTVRSRIFRGKEKLESILSNYGRGERYE